MTLKEQLKEKKSALLALKERIKADDAEAIAEADAITASIEEIQNSIDASNRAKSMLDKIGNGEGETSDEGVKSASSIGAHFVKNMNKKSAGNRFSATAPEFKAYNDELEVGTVASPQVPRALVTDIDRNIVKEVLAPVYLRNLFGSETISGNALTFFTEGALESATGKPYGFDTVAEGAQKPQLSFADPSPVTVSLDKVAAFIKETDEYIDDAPFLASAINGRLMNYLRLYEENYLLTKLSGTSGIGADTTSWADADMSNATAIADLIFKKIMLVQEQSGFAADAIIMHPSVWQTLRLAKETSSSNLYVGGGYFADTTNKTLWGIPVYTSTFIEAPVSGEAKGKILVGSFKNCASVVGKGGVRIDVTNSDGTDFEYNRMTIRAEERLALAVRRPAGFVEITKAASAE